MFRPKDIKFWHLITYSENRWFIQVLWLRVVVKVFKNAKLTDPKYLSNSAIGILSGSVLEESFLSFNGTSYWMELFLQVSQYKPKNCLPLKYGGKDRDVTILLKILRSKNAGCDMRNFHAHAHCKYKADYWKKLIFFPSNWPGFPHPVCSELEKEVSEWRSVIAVSLNVGGGVRLINRQNCTSTRKTQHTLR